MIEAIEARYPGSVKHAEIQIHKNNFENFTDFDVVTDTHIIQVKVGGGKAIVPQIQLSQSLTDLPVVGFDARKLIGRSNGFKTSILRNAQQNGIFITNNVEELLNALGEAKNEIRNPNLKL